MMSTRFKLGITSRRAMLSKARPRHWGRTCLTTTDLGVRGSTPLGRANFFRLLGEFLAAIWQLALPTPALPS